jgi:hypothetical protein
LTDYRNRRIEYTNTKRCRIGLKSSSNRLRSVSNMKERDLVGFEKDFLSLKQKIKLFKNLLHCGNTCNDFKHFTMITI